MDLFDFDYTFEITEEAIQEALQEVITHAKATSNTPAFHLTNKYGSVAKLSSRTKMMLPELEKRGYLRLWGDSESRMVSLSDEHRDYHNPEEVATEFKQKAYAFLATGKSYYDLYQIRNYPHGPGISDAVYRAFDEIGIELGIDHLRKNPKALGTKMHRWRKDEKPMLDTIIAALVPMKSWKEVDMFFKSHCFNFPPSPYSGTHSYVNYYSSAFKNQCIAQSDNPKEIAEIIAHMGCSWMRPDHVKEGFTVLHPGDTVYDMIVIEDDEPDDDDMFDEDAEYDDDDEDDSEDVILDAELEIAV